jgi:CheY-like chemotaxis protein
LEALTDVFVLDILMPDVDGFEMCRQLNSTLGLEGVKVTR